MEFFDVLNERYSVRKFKDEQIKPEDLKKIIAAAGIAPSAKNAQNWHFVVIQNKELIEKMGQTVDAKMEKIAGGLGEEKGAKFLKFSRFSTFFRNAPTVVAVYAKEYVPEGLKEVLDSKMPPIDGERMWYANPGIQSIGAGIENMILASFALGYGACWMTSANHTLRELEEVINFKEDKHKLVALVPMGVPDGERKSPAKLPVEEIMTVIE